MLKTSAAKHAQEDAYYDYIDKNLFFSRTHTKAIIEIPPDHHSEVIWPPWIRRNLPKFTWNKERRWYQAPLEALPYAIQTYTIAKHNRPPMSAGAAAYLREHKHVRF